MTASGAAEGMEVDVAAGDRVDGSWVRELLAAFKPGLETELGPQPATTKTSTRSALLLIRRSTI